MLSRFNFERTEKFIHMSIFCSPNTSTITRTARRSVGSLIPRTPTGARINSFNIELLNKEFNRGFRKRPQFPYKLGQPSHETRPHVIPAPGDLTPGITALEYFDRRLKFIQGLPQNSVTILLGHQVQYSSGSVFYDFQQNNDLYYLTGWLEPNSIAVLEKVGNRGTDEDLVFHMLVPEKNPQVEIWEGERSGLQGCYEFFNPDEVEDITNAKSYLTKLIKRNKFVFADKLVIQESSLFFPLSNSNTNKDSISQVLKSNGSGKVIKPVNNLIANMREFKSPAEVKVMHKAGKISSQAINKAMAKVSTQEIQSEKTLGAYLQYEFIRGGCSNQAYIPVVASGENSLIIHYTRNDDLLYEGEMTFIDAGGKLGGYCSDISRTWPNSGKFSQPQKDLYEIVLNVNKTCIDKCYEDNQMSINDLHEFSVTKLLGNLKQLPGFSHTTKSELTRYLYPHYIGHHLGLDLHDIPSVSKFKTLQTNNVVTIEPGIYIPKDDRFPKHFQGIGIRVEDDVVVGKSSSEILNLTSGCVKEIPDIESLMKEGKCTTPGIYDELIDLNIE